MRKGYNLVELFSGIGSQAKALQNIKMSINVVGTCEWDIQAMCAYDAIHNSTEIPKRISALSKNELLDILSNYTLSNNGKQPLEQETLKQYPAEVLQRIYTAIIRSKNFVDINAMTGDSIPCRVDIMTYSFPCQDLSNVGAFHGYNKGIDRDSGSRSSLLWQVGRILTEMKTSGKELPRYLLMENVPTLLSERHKKNFTEWISDLESLGYYSKYYQLNAHDFGMPQNRPRLLMISVLTNKDKELEAIVKKSLDKDEEKIVSEYKASLFYNKYEVQDMLRIDYSNEKLFAEACECNPNNTVSRQKIWDENPQIVLKDGKINPEFDCVRTITTKQDRHPNSGNLYFESGIEGRSKFRYLTPRECLLFMGFSDEDYENIVRNNPAHHGTVLFPRDKIIRMAGNSIPVKLLEGTFLQIKKLDRKINRYYGCSR